MLLSANELNLHSTMFLLNPEVVSFDYTDAEFTFHYVSIKSMSIRQLLVNLVEFTFHYVSIKSMLSVLNYGIESEFTFHYVSIKSIFIYSSYVVVSSFTFHYVSIKSLKVMRNWQSVLNLHSTMFLLNRKVKCKDLVITGIYIPLCFY